ncbi:MAG: hypothetical protein ABI416_13890 [Ginsengibacter sp.]
MMILSNHSVLKLFTGLATAAFIARRLTANEVITKAPLPTAAKPTMIIGHDTMNYKL